MAENVIMIIINNCDVGNELERGLKKIGRDDVIKKCMYNIEEVTDEVEQAVANFELEHTGTSSPVLCEDVTLCPLVLLPVLENLESHGI